MNITNGTNNKFITFGPQEKIFAVLALTSAIGLSFGLHALIAGHDSTFGTSREVPWGLLISPYVFFACMSTGLCIVASLGQVFRIQSFEPLVNRTVFLALITMATGLMCISLELENPWRVGMYAVLSPHPSSNIWWKTAIYSLYMIFMVFNLLALFLKDKKKARIFAIIALITVTMGNLNMNSDMAILGDRGFWSENYMPLYFLSLSTLTGCALILLFTQIAGYLNREPLTDEMKLALKATSKLFLIMLFGVLYFTGVKVMGGFSQHFTKNPEAMYLLVKGNFATNFWVGEVFLAVVFPIVLLLLNKSRSKVIMALASISCLVGSFVLFYDLVIVGQLIPHYSQYNVVGLPQYYSYTPSLHETMITVGAVFFFFSAFVFGEILFKKINFGE
jgi:molybdopterin-containing oxidoreductase family membrane subunit